MASPPVTFPCPFCVRRMGVPAELLGKQVRCPHCKQVVLAPVNVPGAPVPQAPPQAAVPPAPPGPLPATPQAAAPAPIPAPAPVPPQPIVIVSPPPPAAPFPPPAPAPEPELPVFNIPQRKEGADSIMSEEGESDDEVFGSHPGTRLPAIPPLDLPVAPQAAAPAPAPIPAPAPSQAPTTTQANPFADLEPVSLPAVFAAQAPPAPLPATPQAAAPAPLPVPVPQPVSAPIPLPAPAGGNPFADFDDAPTAAPTATVSNAPKPASAPTIEELPDEEEKPRKKKKRAEADEPEEKPARAARGRAAAGAGGGVNPVVLFVVIGYAVLATGIAIYGLFFKSGIDTGNPLSTIPDNFGEFDPATRKKVTSYRFPVDGELPADQRAALKGTAHLGQLEITPLRITKRTLVVETETTKGKERPEQSRYPALVLTLAIKNNSDISLYPMDPAFTRKADQGREDKPITRVVVGKGQYYSGGFIQWPLSGSIKKKFDQQQANDYKPLGPGETREYIVFTDARVDVVKAIETAKETMQWRVQVRRDPIELNGKEIPVTGIIGVDFKASEIE